MSHPQSQAVSGPLARPTSSFRVHIALAFGAIAVVLAGLMSAIFGESMAASIRAEATGSLQVVAGNTARVLANGLDDRFRLVDGLASSPTLWINGLGGAEVGRALGLQQSLLGSLAWIGAADLRGTVRTATGDLLLGVDVSSRPWFAGGKLAPTVGDLHDAKLLASVLPSRPNGEPWRFLDFSAPIRLRGQTIGVLGLHGSWDWARSVVESLLPKDAESTGLEVFIFDHRGALIYAPHGKFGALAAAGQHLPPASANDAAATIRWADGDAFLSAAVPLDSRNPAIDLGWTIVARVPAAATIAKAHDATRNAIAIGAVLALLAALVAWFVAGNVSKPLSAIAAAARRVKDGAADAAIPQFRGSTELAGLSDALATMTARLLAANETLERRVGERTAALEVANAELDRLARFDPLTGLLNRRGFDEQMRRLVADARRRGSSLAMVMVDADHFKRVNDTFGHDVGDQVLRALAGILGQRARGSDVLGRLGGEEFALLLPDTGLDGAHSVAAALVEAVRVAIMPRAGSITVSCGIALLRDAESGAEALTRADRSLYRAKSSGRDQAAFVDTSLELAS